MMTARDTDDFLHCHIRIRELLLNGVTDPTLLAGFFADVSRKPNTPCILFDAHRNGNRHLHVPPRKSQGTGSLWLISCSRAAFAVARMNMRTHLAKRNEALHTCGNSGDHDTGHMCCVNPHHIIAGTCDDRITAKIARQNLRAVYQDAAPTDSLIATR